MLATGSNASTQFSIFFKFIWCVCHSHAKNTKIFEFFSFPQTRTHQFLDSPHLECIKIETYKPSDKSLPNSNKFTWISFHSFLQENSIFRSNYSINRSFDGILYILHPSLANFAISSKPNRIDVCVCSRRKQTTKRMKRFTQNLLKCRLWK